MRQEPLRKLFSLRNWLMVFGALLMLAGLVSQTPSAQAQDSQQVAQLDFSAFDGLGESRELRVERRESLSFAAFDALAPITAPTGLPVLSFAAFDLACPCGPGCVCVDCRCRAVEPAKKEPPQKQTSQRNAHSVDSTLDGRTAVWVYKPAIGECGPCQTMERQLRSGDRELGLIYAYGCPAGVDEVYPIIQWRVSGKVHTVHGARTLEQLKAEIAKSRGT